MRSCQLSFPALVLGTLVASMPAVALAQSAAAPVDPASQPAQDPAPEPAPAAEEDVPFQPAQEAPEASSMPSAAASQPAEGMPPADSAAVQGEDEGLEASLRGRINMGQSKLPRLVFYNAHGRTFPSALTWMGATVAVAGALDGLGAFGGLTAAVIYAIINPSVFNGGSGALPGATLGGAPAALLLLAPIALALTAVGVLAVLGGAAMVGADLLLHPAKEG